MKKLLLLTFCFICTGCFLLNSEDKSDVITDTDIDGIANSVDKCSESPAGEKVDRIGCTGLQRFGLEFEPGSTVELGQEVLYKALTLLDSEDVSKLNFRWDFGDDLVKGTEGKSVTHFYMRPGTFNISLNVLRPDNTEFVLNSTIEVTGEYPKIPPMSSSNPVLELKFEDNINDTSTNGLTVSCKENETPDYVDGISGRALDLTNGKYLQVGDKLGGIINGNEITISLYFKKANVDAYGYFVQKQHPTEGRSYELKFGEGSYYGGKINDSHCHTYGLPNDIHSNTSWHHYVMTYDGTTVRIYIDGKEITETNNSEVRSPIPLSETINTSNADIFIGRAYNASDVFNGYIDEVKIYNKALSVEEIRSSGLSVLHADFHVHTAQYLFVQIPSSLTSDSANKISAEIVGDGNGFTAETLVDKNVLSMEKTEFINLSSEEKILLKNALLPAGNYTLSIQIRNSANTILDEVTETFNKPYDGIPKVGINENNAVVIKTIVGENEVPVPFFPITPFGLNNIDVEHWVDEKYINATYVQGFAGSERTPEGWIEYLDLTEVAGVKASGPTAWEGFLSDHRDRNSDINNIVEYIMAAKDHENMLMWQWADEPDLGNKTQHLPETVLRSWTYMCHKLDPQRPVVTTLAGPNFVHEKDDYWSQWRRNYMYRYNANKFGRGTHVTDIYGLDYYPVDWQESHHYHRATFAKLAQALDNMKEDTYNLVPFFSAIETTDINEGEPPPTKWHPTPEQLKMLIWLNIVHGAKGIIWFHYLKGPLDENYEVTSKFVKTMEEYTPIVLAPEINKDIVTDVEYSDLNWTWNSNVLYPGWKAGDSFDTGDIIQHNNACYKSKSENTGIEDNEPGEGDHWRDSWQIIGDRVDTMIREYDGNLYLFAVRISEVGPDPNPENPHQINSNGRDDSPEGYPDPVQNYTVTATFEIEGISNSTAHVYKEIMNNEIEERTISILNDTFTDRFEPYEVHIYKIVKNN